eukprot:symbB.v1.2.000383.t1/scaffold17.1/size449391/20
MSVASASPAFVVPTALRGTNPAVAPTVTPGALPAMAFGSAMFSAVAVGAATVASQRRGLRKARARAVAMRASVDEMIAEHDVIAFISPTCPFCKEAVAALKDAGYEPFVVEAGTYSEIRSELTEKTNSSSVPKVWVKGNFIGGCNDGGMGGVLPLLKSGKIKELMS